MCIHIHIIYIKNVTIQLKVGVNKSLEIFWTFSSCITYSRKYQKLLLIVCYSLMEHGLQWLFSKGLQYCSHLKKIFLALVFFLSRLLCISMNKYNALLNIKSPVRYLIKVLSMYSAAKLFLICMAGFCLENFINGKQNVYTCDSTKDST